MKSLPLFLDCPSCRTGAIVITDGHYQPQSRSIKTLWDHYEDWDVISWWTFAVWTFTLELWTCPGCDVRRLNIRAGGWSPRGRQQKLVLDQKEQRPSVSPSASCFTAWTAARSTWAEQQWEDGLRVTGSSHHLWFRPTPVIITTRPSEVVEPPTTHTFLFFLFFFF